MHSTRYIVTFVIILTAVVALVLSLMATGLKPIHDRNEAIYNKKAIISAIETDLGMAVNDLSGEEIQSIFDEKIKQVVVDDEGNVLDGIQAEDVDMAKEKKKPVPERKFPIYVYDAPDGKIYIVSVRGSGLWDEIWGNIALEDDFNTVAGAAFDHKGETPGLGAEIKDNPNFADQFEGKKLYGEGGEFTSIAVVKNGASGVHQVDGISGATITGNGVEDMLELGIKYYEPYFEKIGKAN
ncbi:MAG: NADH:ubiquinone reductase (Na(+)-transporting) subunit C [Saprospiraceae bacterium]|nr:NADH:ubiquinone reductase (Na(+)-transporting) subunit C [Saprospiraceae bacterium]